MYFDSSGKQGLLVQREATEYGRCDGVSREASMKPCINSAADTQRCLLAVLVAWSPLERSEATSKALKEGKFAERNHIWKRQRHPESTDAFQSARLGRINSSTYGTTLNHSTLPSHSTSLSSHLTAPPPHQARLEQITFQSIR
jgi:hypothetical protein